MNLAFAKVIKSRGFESYAAWKRAANGVASWLDNVDFSPEEWCLVQRRRWDIKSSRIGFSCEARDFEIETADSIKDNEQVIGEEHADQ